MNLARLICCTCFVLVAATPLWAQRILIDKPYKVGQLTVFPDVKEQRQFYYLPSKVRLAPQDDTGLPQFSFLHYAPDVRHKKASEGLHGGIVHAVVELYVSPEQRREAERALQRLVPGAKLMGPVMFQAGKFGLVTSFQGSGDDKTKRVVGLGNAPLLEGTKAAVSLQLSREGAQILWESFRTATPDVSFTFDMDVRGYRSPFNATVKVDWEKVRTHKAFGAAIATPVMGGEIRKAFDELRAQQAIQIDQTGEDARMDQLIETAYEKIIAVMFEPVNASSTGSLVGLSPIQEQSLLAMATANLERRRAETRQDNAIIRLENQRLRREAAARRAAAHGTGIPASAESDQPGPSPQVGRGLPDDSSARIGIAGRQIGVQRPTRLGHVASSDPVPAPKKEKPLPKFSAIGMYRMKRISVSQEFRLDLQKHSVETLTMRFDENIGRLAEFADNPEVFRKVNLYDPLYRLRHVDVVLDGTSGQDFGNYINSVSLQLIKKHGDGSTSIVPFIRNRRTFKEMGAGESLVYHWKDEPNELSWNEYEYTVTWHLFGGHHIALPKVKESDGSVVLVPPYVLRRIAIEANPDMLTERKVRAATVTVFYDVAGKNLQAQQSIRVAPGETFARELTFLAEPGRQYEYAIDWAFEDGATKTTEKRLIVGNDIPMNPESS